MLAVAMRWRAALVLLSAALALALLLAPPAAAPSGADALELASAERQPQFERALEPVPLQFPRDHGAHFGFETEWWYFTGNLTAEDGSAFGYQLTIFRRGLAPGVAQRDSDLAANHLYFAHFAVTDAARGEHQAYERFSRGAGGLAGASATGMQVHLADWSIRMADPTIQLQASELRHGLSLSLIPAKPAVAHGEDGLSAKGDQPGNASYYVSLTDLDTTGWLEVDAQRYQVSGKSWFDHEWGTSALGPAAVGWDWFAIQLTDGRDLMLFQLRRQDGSVEPISGGTIVSPEGRSRRLSLDQIELTVQDTWRAESGPEYPVRWRIQIPSEGLDLRVEPLLEDQQNELAIVYWEGAIRVSGSHFGVGYLELTGYGDGLPGLN